MAISSPARKSRKTTTKGKTITYNRKPRVAAETEAEATAALSITHYLQTHSWADLSALVQKAMQEERTESLLDTGRVIDAVADGAGATVGTAGDYLLSLDKDAYLIDLQKELELGVEVLQDLIDELGPTAKLASKYEG